MDLRAIADVIKTDELELTHDSPAILGRRFLRHLALYGKMDGNTVPPIATRGTIYLYNDSEGAWEELHHEDALSLIHCYDGLTIGKRGTLGIGPRKAKEVHQAAALDLEHRDFAFFDSAVSGVAFRNGFVTVSADGLTLHDKSPEHRAAHCLPFDYDTNAECPEWTAVLKRVFKGSPSPEDDARLLQEFIGACLTGMAWQRARCLILSGGGNNGKSVVVEFITDQLFPQRAVSYTSPQSWARPEFLSRLRDARLNVANEMPATDIQAGDVFKAVIDGGAVTAKNLYENPYTLKPRAGHIFLCNELPGNRDNSDGFWRRVLVLPFKRNFTKDPDETGKLRTKEEVKATLAKELPGVALWALYGAVRLLRQGGYTIPESHKRAIREWRDDVDQVSAFLSECAKFDGGTTHHGEIHRAFKEWCELNGRQVIGNRKLATRLRMLEVQDGHDREGLFFRMTVMMKAAWGIGKGVSASV